MPSRISSTPGPSGFDRWDVFYPFAPKPLLITVSDKDSFGTYSSNYISNGWEEYQKLRKVYALAGKPKNLAWSDTPLPHGLSYDSRLQVYNWLRAAPARARPSRSRRNRRRRPSPTPRCGCARAATWHALHSETPFSLNRHARGEEIGRCRSTGCCGSNGLPPIAR